MSELPTPRPASVLPHREKLWLMLENPAGAVLVERRPPQGIWGGLWSLPEFGEYEALRSALALRFGQADPDLQELTPVRHVFTHFSLTARPIHVVIRSASNSVVDTDDERWVLREELADIGLPQPIRTLLAARRFDDV